MRSFLTAVVVAHRPVATPAASSRSDLGASWRQSLEAVPDFAACRPTHSAVQ